MTLVVAERPKITGTSNGRRLTYLVQDDAGGNVSSSQAVAAVIDADPEVAPDTYDGYPLQDYELTEIATDRYDVACIYELNQSGRQRPEVTAYGTLSYSSTTSLESVQIKQSFATSRYYDSAQVPAGVTDAPDFGGSINVSSDAELRVQGTSIQVPVTKIKLRGRITNAQATQAFQVQCEDAAGKVNSDEYLGRAAGSLRFDGAEFLTRDLVSWDLTYNFTRRPNLSDATIGAITGVDAAGWDFIWPMFLGSVESAQRIPVTKPAYLYVEQVYPRVAFGTALELPS